MTPPSPMSAGLRVAMAHLDLSRGPQRRNLAKLSIALEKAAAAGADWLITPELAVQGYFFREDDPAPAIPVQPSPDVEPLIEAATGHGIGLFLGCAERIGQSGLSHNSCLVIGPDGTVLGRHHKTKRIGSAEAWATPGTEIEPIACPDLRAGVLVCADSWEVGNAVTLKGKGAAVVVVPAAWPPGEHGPGGCWERGSVASGLPYWVCNQTGVHPRLDFRAAVSTVIVGGQARLSYDGPDETLLLFDWDLDHGDVLSPAFERISI